MSLWVLLDMLCFSSAETCIPATYFLLYSSLPTYSATCLNRTWLEAKNAFVSMRLPNVSVYMVSGFGTLALEGDDFLLASLAF